MSLRLKGILLWQIVPILFAQSYTISTFAGGQPVNVSGTSMSVNAQPIAADAAGNLFFAGQNVVLRLDSATGVVTVVAGTGAQGFSGDNGPATNAQLSGVAGLAVDSADNIYVADSNGIRFISNGVITTVGGNGTPGFSGDGGPAIDASLNEPGALAVDSTGTLYVADVRNRRIRRVLNGVITTVAGNGKSAPVVDNVAATDASIGIPTGLAADAMGGLYILDAAVNQVFKVSGGEFTVIAGGQQGFGGDGGPATAAQLNFNIDGGALAIDPAGNLFIADTANFCVRKISNGLITTVAGRGGSFAENVPATTAQFSTPKAVAVDSHGNIYIGDILLYRIRKVSNGVIATVVGNGMRSFSGDGGPATNAQLDTPSGVAVDSAGNVFIADTGNARIRKVSNGAIATVAGGGSVPYGNGDNGPATAARLSPPRSIAVDDAGNLYMSDSYIRRVLQGVITPVTGNWASGSSGSGCQAVYYGQLSGVVAVDPQGNLYVGNSRCVLKVSNGVITAVAGNGTQGFSGDNGPATEAELSGVSAIAVDHAGGIYFVDNSRVRKVFNGVITTVAGNGAVNGPLGDGGPAISATLGYPTAITVDSSGNLYIADSGDRVRKVSGGVINTIAGSTLLPFRFGFNGDGGPATSALMFGPVGLSVDSAGRVYIADSNNGRNSPPHAR